MQRNRSTTNARPEPLRRRASTGRRTILALALAIAAIAARAPAALPEHPRRLEYRVAWNGIPAAGATVAIQPADLAGHPGVVVEANARTNAFVDLFWTFRGTARSTFLADGLTPLHFVYDRQMAGKPYLTWIDFDAEAQNARSVYIKGTRRRELAVDGPDLVDPITAVFRARLSGAKSGDTIRYDIWTGESRYRVELAVKGLEAIDVPAGHFSALRIEPTVYKLGTSAERDQRLRQATIWVADDPLRTLLRIRSEIFIGAVTLDLVRVEPAA
ncbi:MAG: DUF3108 domain-containing protein [Candidatus Binatia bacterium]